MGKRNRWCRNMVGDRQLPAQAGKWGHFLAFSLARGG